MPDETQVQEPNEQLDTTQNTEEAPQTPTQPVDPSVLSAYQQQLLQQSRDNARLQRELEEARRPVQQAPTAEQEKEFFDKPRSSVAEIVRHEMKQQTEPLNQFVAQMQRQQLIENLKGQMRSNPSQFPYIGQLEGMFDQIMTQAGVIDANTAIAAYNTALGYYISNGGQLNTQTPTQQQPNRTNVPTPPPFKPTAPPPSPTSSNRKVRQLNENEKKIARFNGFSDEEYLVYTEELTPKEVAKISDDEIKKRVGGKR